MLKNKVTLRSIEENDEVVWNQINETTKSKSAGTYTLPFSSKENKWGKSSLGAFTENVFDEDYEESYGYPQPGRTAYAGMTVRF